MELLFKFRLAACAYLCSFIVVLMPAIASAESAVKSDEVAADTNSVVSAVEKPNWAVTGYVAWLSGDQLGDMVVFNAELEENRVAVIALTRRLMTFGPDVDWELEGQIGKHSGSSTPSFAEGETIEMDHWEFNVLTSVRWNKFFWDKYVETSAAAGLGVSYATETPEFERLAHCIDGECNSNRLMAYILAELTLALPKHPQWAAVMRIHHRSSAYGTFEEDIEGASNALGLGIKYRF